MKAHQIFRGDYPSWWQSWSGLSPFWPWLLLPAMWLYIALSALRPFFSKSCKVSIPVACVGNITVGGVGKTPILIDIVRGLQQQGIAIHVIGHGYRAKQQSVHRVEIAQDSAQQVGDEALMLAGIAPTWIGGTRYQRAQAAIKAGAELLIMDDGWQDPCLEKDYVVAVINGHSPLGNGWRLPLGPLRQSPSVLSQANYIIAVKNSENVDNYGKAISLNPHCVLQRRCCWLHQAPAIQQAVVFCGIGQSGQFFHAARALCAEANIEVIDCIGFADHHPYQEHELLEIQDDYPAAAMITTFKDWQRLDQVWRDRVIVIDLQLVDQDNQYPKTVVSALVRLHQNR